MVVAFDMVGLAGLIATLYFGSARSVIQFGIMKAISIKLPDPLFRDLARHAEASASSQSDIVRNALKAYLQAEGLAQPGSCAERAVRWTGIVEGPADLSTNPEHLRDFGR